MADRTKQGSKLDLNLASRDELAEVPGIGASTADAIIAYRKQHGGFKKVAELEEVSGIGKQTLDTIRARFKVAADAKPGAGGNGRAAESPKRQQAAPDTAAMVSPAGAATPPEAAERAAEAASELQERGAEAAKRNASAQVEAMRQTSGKGAEAMQEMSEKSAEAMKTASESTGRGAEAFASMSRRNVESLQASGGTMLDAARQLQQEWLGFWQTQVQESVRAGQALATCRTPQDIMQVQADFARSSMERFIAEAGRFRDLTTRMMALGFEPLQTATRRNIREAAERTRD